MLFMITALLVPFKLISVMVPSICIFISSQVLQADRLSCGSYPLQPCSLIMLHMFQTSIELMMLSSECFIYDYRSRQAFDHRNFSVQDIIWVAAIVHRLT